MLNCRKNYKQASLIKYILSHPTHYHEFQLKYLSQVSTLACLFSTHHPTQPQLSPPHLSSASLLLIKVTLHVSWFSPPSVKPTYKLMPSRISWHSTPCPSHWPFVVQTSGKPNHVVRATSSGYTKPRAIFSPQQHSMHQTTCPHSTNHLQHHSTKGQHDTLYGSIALPFK